MSDTTTSTSSAVDEGARFRAFTALALGAVALVLALPTRSSDDALVRPVARTATALSVVAIVASLVLLMVTVGDV